MIKFIFWHQIRIRLVQKRPLEERFFKKSVFKQTQKLPKTNGCWFGKAWIFAQFVILDYISKEDIITFHFTPYLTVLAAKASFQSGSRNGIGPVFASLKLRGHIIKLLWLALFSPNCWNIQVHFQYLDNKLSEKA